MPANAGTRGATRSTGSSSTSEADLDLVDPPVVDEIAGVQDDPSSDHARRQVHDIVVLTVCRCLCRGNDQAQRSLRERSCVSTSDLYRGEQMLLLVCRVKGRDSRDIDETAVVLDDSSLLYDQRIRRAVGAHEVVEAHGLDALQRASRRMGVDESLHLLLDLAHGGCRSRVQVVGLGPAAGSDAEQGKDEHKATQNATHETTS